jgi:hypothetical protein
MQVRHNCGAASSTWKQQGEEGREKERKKPKDDTRIYNYS